VRKDAQGGLADQWFTAAMAATRTDPAFIAIQQKILSSYRGPDWQQG